MFPTKKNGIDPTSNASSEDNLNFTSLESAQAKLEILPSHSADAYTKEIKLGRFSAIKQNFKAKCRDPRYRFQGLFFLIFGIAFIAVVVPFSIASASTIIIYIYIYMKKKLKMRCVFLTFMHIDREAYTQRYAHESKSGNATNTIDVIVHLVSTSAENYELTISTQVNYIHASLLIIIPS